MELQLWNKESLSFFIKTIFSYCPLSKDAYALPTLLSLFS